MAKGKKMNKQELIDKHESSYEIIKMDFPHIKVLNKTKRILHLSKVLVE